MFFVLILSVFSLNIIVNVLGRTVVFLQFTVFTERRLPTCMKLLTNKSILCSVPVSLFVSTIVNEGAYLT